MDKMSSAHVYVRLHKGQTIDDISEGLLEDCAQLVKANSIQGKFIYTPLCNMYIIVGGGKMDGLGNWSIWISFFWEMGQNG